MDLDWIWKNMVYWKWISFSRLTSSLVAMGLLTILKSQVSTAFLTLSSPLLFRQLLFTMDQPLQMEL
jgi:hypothetical protein